MPKGTARLLALVLLAVAVRMLYVGTQLEDSHLGSTDAWGYHRLALNLELGHGFSLRREPPFEPDSVRTPLHPLFLLLVRRLVGPHPRTAALVQAMLEGISVVLTYRLTVLLAAALGSTTGQRAGRFSALLYSLNPVQVRQVNELLTETLLACLILLCLCTLVRYLWRHHPATGTDRRHLGDNPTLLATLLGLASALAALCKPNVQYLPLLWLPAMLLGSAARASESRARWKRIQHVALALTAFVGLLAPWVARNQVVFGRPFLSTAFHGNVSRISAPATLLTARGQYAIPWSAEWEAAFGEIVAEAARRYRWAQPWERMDVRAREQANRQVYLVARETLAQHPLAWVSSHLQGTLRYLEPQTYRAIYAEWTGQTWPPDVLDDAVIHALRALARGEAHHAGQIIAQERWSRLTSLQRATWWSTFVAILITTALAVRGAWVLCHRPALLWTMLATIAYVLLLPGPIAYERFRVPVLGPILALAALSFASPKGLCYNRRRRSSLARANKPNRAP